MKYTIALLLTTLFFACENSNSKIVRNIKQKGDSITTTTQKLLLKNLTLKISDSGTTKAITFCNIQANNLTQQFFENDVKSIQRLSAKNRNPLNILQSKTDSLVYHLYLKKELKHDTVILEDNNVLYYKPINMAMPTCLKCHGTDLEKDVQNILKEKYPNDLAKNYLLNDFRAIWKVVYPK